MFEPVFLKWRRYWLPAVLELLFYSLRRKLRATFLTLQKVLLQFFSSPAISLPQLIAADLDASRVHNNFPAHCSFSLSIFYPRQDPAAYIFYEKRFFYQKKSAVKNQIKNSLKIMWQCLLSIIQ